MIATCIDCGELFDQRAEWAVRCFPCWKARKEARGGLRAHPDPRLPNVTDWSEMLPRLLRLAHLDRHGNSRMANATTQWLLEQRRKLEVRQ